CDLAPFTARHLTFIPPITVFPTMTVSAAHGGRVCSTWGDFHYKTFDGDVFRFPGLCNYVFSAHCGSAYEDFNLQLRRGLLGSRPTITHIVLRSQGLVLEVSNGSVLINGWREELPYSRAGLLVERSSAYVKINIRLMLTFMWNGEDSALLELDPKYANQTCGLCGDFNGLRAVSEFYTHNARLSPLQFGNLQKLDGPTEQCQDPLPSPAADNCTDEEGVCRSTLLGPAFAPCHGLVDAEVYVAACTQDLCRCPTCPCATFAEYSRQCAHAGGQPQNWRGPDLCPQTCPLNTRHQECGSPCVDTCSNPERSQLCEDHCVDGCFCPPDTVLDDVTHTGCLPLRQCPCTRGGRIYAPGASFNTSCSSCTCSGGLWQCQDLPCPGTCSVQGGSHISTYDEKLYDVHGDCSYVLTKVCADSALTVLADLRKCGLTDNENCLKTVTLSLNGGDTTVQIQANGGVFVNSIYTQLPVSVADVTVFRPSSFFILVQTGPWLQLQVQLAPLMQVFLRLDPAYRGRMCGLCGNFNQNQADDFRTVGGVVEATAAAFANTWKTQAACPNVKNSFEDPCSLSVENENYARHWCSLLTRPAGPFSPCHSVVSPGPFHSNCLFDTCNCEKSEDCMCAALSSYVWACAARGVLLRGWRDGVCTKYASSCPKTQSYAHVVDSCQPTCRSLSQPDVSCDVAFVPVDGCVCPQGTFLDDAGDCVPAEACPCYLGGTVVAPGEVVHDSGVVCSCVSGRLSCLGATEQSTGCVAPMVFLDCSNASADAPGAECVRSCHTLDVDCFSTHCVSGCVCPVGLLSDGSGGCVAKEDCPCVHNEAAYKPGQVIKVDCNTCTCRGRRWECSDRPCLGTCVAYGDGHFLTFDGERYGFEGSCEYTLAQDYCVGGDTANGTFRIVTENVPCGTTGVTCSKAIKIFLGSYELILHEGTHRVLQRGPGGDLPYRVRYMGVYLTVETHSGVVVSWDRKTSVIIRLRHEYKGRVCGLCGNFDDNALNDFTTRSQSVVGDVLEFGNSWKFSPSCPDALAPRDPCTANPYRRSWAQKQCSIINSATFSACRSQVDSTRYYEACVSDACACDSGADCECFCTAVAAYAQACHEAGVCVSWRTPDVCPLFCDYYNPHGECEWHYQPCGVPCLKTCRNPSGLCLMDLPGLEGCYPECPPSKPLFNEDRMECVAQCSGCYDRDGNYYDVGTRVPTTENCQSCACTSSGLQCTHTCTCTYEGRTYAYGDVIYNTTDGLGACLIAICRDNGTIVRRAMECPGTPSITPFTFTSTAAPPSTTGLVPTPSTVCVRKACQWSDWYDGGRPEPGVSGGDFETFENLRQRGYQVCLAPVDIECQAQLFPGMPLEKLAQKVECSQDKGLTCLNSEQSPPLCHNYKLRVLCCDYVPCGTSQPPSSQTTPTRPPTHPTTAVLTSQTATTKLTTTTTSEGSSSVFPATTTCEPHCQWTEWFDVDYPKYEEGGGDFETYEKIRAAGGAVCEQPQEIKCEAENYPGLALEQVGQRVHCDVRFGLVCRNEEQPGLFKMCINYRVSVLCCSSRCTLTTATTSPTATATVPTATTATVPTSTTATVPTSTTATVPTSTTATVPTSTTATVPTATTATVPTATTTTVPTATTATVPTSTTATVPTSTTATVPTSTTATVPMSTTATVPTSTTATVPTSTTTATVPTATTATVPTSTTATVPTSTTTATVSTATSPEAPLSTTGTPSTQHPRTSTPVPATATTGPTTSQAMTSCQPECTWTEWFDVDYPKYEEGGGDFETYEKIRAAGGAVCEQPQEIKCEAENYPGLRVEQVGQRVNCDVRFGLVCRNEEQLGLFKMCINYRVSVLCCSSRCTLTTATTSPTATATVPTSTTATVPTSTTATVPTSTTATVPTSTTATVPTSTTATVPTATTATVPTSTTATVPTATTATVPTETTTTATVPTASTATVPMSTTATVPTSTAATVPTATTATVPTETTTTATVPTASTATVPTSTTATVPTATTTTATVPTSTTATVPMATTTTVTSTPVPATATTGPTTSQATTSCQPECTWTEWFDVDYPKYEEGGGDFETYEKIRAAGGAVCEQPQEIKCEAENYPGLRVEQVGQRVHCDVRFGLVCRNEEQLGLFKMCINYRVSVLCCSSRCTLTTAPTSPTATATGSTATVPMATTATATVPTSTTATVPTATTATVPTSTTATVPTSTTATVPTSTTATVPTATTATVPTSTTATVPTVTTATATVPTSTTATVPTSTTATVPTVTTATVPMVTTATVPTSTTATVPTSTTATVPTSTTATVPTSTTATVPTSTTATVRMVTTATATVPTSTTATVPTSTTATVPTSTTATVPTVTTATVPMATTATVPTSTTATVPTVTTATVPTETTTTATVHTATTATATVPTSTTATVPTSTTATVPTSTTATVHTATTATATVPTSTTATVPTATTTTATVPTSTTTATVPTSTTATVPMSTTATVPTSTTTATVPTGTTATVPTATTTTATVPTSTPSIAPGTTATSLTVPTVTATTATVPTATTTATATVPMATTATVPTSTPSIAPATTATSLTVPTVTATTATVPMATPSTATISTAATSNATALTATVVTATVPTATISAGTVPTASTASSTSSTAVPTPTQTRTQTRSTVVPGSPASSATPVPALSTGLTTRATSSSPGHTSTLPTIPRGSTGSTTLGTATSVLPTQKTSQGPTSALATTQISTAGSQPEAPLSTTGTPSTQHPRTSTPVPATATTGPTTSQATTSCQPKCTWTEWFDVDFPTSGVTGGDIETYANIRAAGGKMCQDPEKIECRAESYPEVSIDQIGQVLTCSLETGLVCQNADQRGPFTMCFNYNVRVYCCDDARHCPTTASPDLRSTSLPPGSSPGTGPWPPTSTTAWPPLSTSKALPTTPKPTWTGAPSTVTLVTSHIPESTSVTSLPTTHTHFLPPTTSKGTTQVAELPTRPSETTTRPPVTTLSTGQATSSTGAGTRTSLSPPGPEPSTSSLGTTLGTPTTTTTSVATLSSPKAHTSGTTLVPTSAGTASTTCEHQCAWTDWMDQSYPHPGADGGDFETYANIRAAGGAICEQPLKLECRAEPLPDTPLTDLGQVVLCQREVGLVCRNQDQSGQMCFNYQIRLLCCEKSYCPSTAITTSTPTPTSETGPASTRVSTPTTVTGPSSTVTTERVSTPTSVTGPVSTVTTERVSTLTSETGPASTVTTEKTSTHTSETGPASTVTTERVSTTTSVTGPASTVTTERVSTLTSETGPSSTVTTERVSTPTSETGPASTVTTEKTSTPTSVTGPASTVTTERVSTPTTVTGPSSTVTTERVSTPTSVTGPSSTVTTERVSTPTSETGPSSTVTTEKTSTHTSVTGPASTVTTERVSTPTSVTGPASTVTTEKTSTHTSVTGPASTVTTERVSTLTSETGPASTVTTEKTSTPTSVTGPASTVTTERVSTLTSETGPSSTVTTERVSTPTSETGLASTVTTERVSTPTSVTGPASPVTTEKTSTPTRPSSMGTTERMSISSPSPFPGSSPLTTKPDLSSISTSPLLTTPVSPLTTPSWSSETSGSLMPSVVPATSPSPTTPCLCHAFGKFFLPGDVVYNKTDGAGCPFLAICNQRCELDRFQGACTTSSPTGTSASVPPTTPVSGCDRTIPPRKVNESWFLEDCTVARCEGDNRVTLLGPRPMNSITCVNGHLPVKVQNQSHHCAYRYECECVCSAWGSSHYETFDGASYTFRDNCTYVLVREIQPRHGNFRVLLHNRFCEAAAHCPRALSTHYQSTDVVLSTTTSADGQEESLILLDQTRVRQSFSKNGVAVTLTGATGMRVDIPAIGVSITFNGRVFQARLSYSHFSHNTEGQCGTCTNNRRDECRRPDGTMARTCRDMARSWLVSDSSGEGCGEPTGLPPTTSPLLPGTSTPAIHPSCPPEPLCELMLSSVFAGCHSLIPPGPYFNACVSDSCWPGHGRKVLCQSLETYAELCRSRGVCADWRNATHGLCDLACPPTKVYKSCGPVQPESCDSSLQSVGLAEGCFCPDGHILFNSHRDICVPECSCVGPDGLPKVPGERWISNCQSCVCDKGTVSVQCVPMECPAPDQPQECSRAGFVAVSRPLANNPCCMENLCVCNASTCPQSPPACGRGEKVVRTQVEGDCCPTFICEPLLCSFNGTVYGVGATVPGVAPCHTCACLSMGSEDPTVQCEEEACNTTCLPGFEYSTVAGQCCGECVQTSCLAPDGQLVQFNETWINSLVDNCTEYHCQARDGPPMLTPTPVVCPDVSPCKGILKKIGCCYSCVQTDACQVHTNMTVLRHRGCVTQTAVKVSFCEGSCPQVSRYSMETQARQCSCSCCQETRTHQEAVTMQCPDGTAFQHTYTHVDECGCVPACASSPQTLEESASTFPTLGSTAV
uniref:Uncharacterized protein n=1 Tax=Ovis aries TaxID=9940 RepID=A0AC11E245_SHEEP